MAAAPAPLVYLSVAFTPADKAHLAALETHLAGPRQAFTWWHRGRIGAGEDVERVAAARLV